MAGRELPTQIVGGGRERFIIGRGNDCRIVIHDSSLSREHCYLIVERDGTYRLVDMNSMNGIAVKQNGSWAKVREAVVSPQDLVKLGLYETPVSALLLQLQGEAEDRLIIREKRYLRILSTK
jgi:predicted component of type VI protein secretion system